MAVEIASGFVGAGIVKQGIEVVALSRTVAVMEAAEQLTPHVRKVVDSAKKLGMTHVDETKLLAKAISAPKINPFELTPTHSLTMSKREFSALKDAMQKDGMLRDTIKTVTHNGQKYIVDGHHRALAAKELGWTEVPVDEVTLPFLGYKTIDDLFN